MMRQCGQTAAMAALLAVACSGAWAQILPGEAPASMPAETQPAKPIVIDPPTVDKNAHSVSLPAAFWNQKLTSWVEVGLCGRPSDFLHETIICVTTTKTKLLEAMREVGFHDADAWVSNVADFPRVRGDRVLVLLEVDRGGKKETYALDELLVFQGWGVSIGPYGWMFKGDPEREQSTTRKADAETAPAEAKKSVAETILADNPQVALQFKGIQHLSQSFIDHPLCYDDWVFPMMRYHRNYNVLPREVYDSNGDVPVKMTMKKVTEAEFIDAVAAVWHDPAFAAYARKQRAIAAQIDKDKADLWAAIPAVRKKAELLRTMDGGLAVLPESDEFRKVAVLAAAVEKGYAALDAAWTLWSCEHVKWDTDDAGEVKELEGQRKLWREHMELKNESAEQTWRAEAAVNQARALRSLPPSDENKTARRKTLGAQIEAQAKATLADNKQTQDYWKYQQSRLTPDDTRKDWRRHIEAQVALAAAKQTLGELGVKLGQDMQGPAKDEDVAKLQADYQRQVLTAMLAGLKLQLADVEFEIAKREGMEGDTDMPELVKRRTDLLKQIAEAEGALKLKKE